MYGATSMPLESATGAPRLSDLLDFQKELFRQKDNIVFLALTARWGPLLCLRVLSKELVVTCLRYRFVGDFALLPLACNHSLAEDRRETFQIFPSVGNTFYRYKLLEPSLRICCHCSLGKSYFYFWTFIVGIWLNHFFAEVQNGNYTFLTLVICLNLMQ